MLVRIRLFAQLRERAGADAVEAELADGATVADALAALSGRPGLGKLLARLPVRMAVNRELVGDDTPLRAGDELALLPPVSGGGGEPHVRVVAEPIVAARVTDLVRRRGAGAVVTFEGTVRDVATLDYEAYVEMAQERMAVIPPSASRATAWRPRRPSTASAASRSASPGSSSPCPQLTARRPSPARGS